MDVRSFKARVESTKQARDFLIAHDTLKTVQCVELELATKQDMPTFLKSAVVHNNEVDLDKLKMHMGVFSFKK